FLCRLDLASGRIRWLVERPWTFFSESAKGLPRRIWVRDWEVASFWMSEDGLRIAEIASADCGGITVSTHDATTGKLLWERLVSAPAVTDWIAPEPTPALAGDQKDQTWAFLAASPAHLILCLTRATTRTVRVNGMSISALPQTEPVARHTEDSPPVPRFRPEMVARRLDPTTGAEVWREHYVDVVVSFLGQRRFDGVWCNGSQVGVIDLDSGTNRVLFESTN